VHKPSVSGLSEEGFAGFTGAVKFYQHEPGIHILTYPISLVNVWIASDVGYLLSTFTSETRRGV